MFDEVSELAETFARFALELHGERGVEETVEAVLEFALQAVGCDHTGLVLARSSGELETAAVTDPLLELSDQLQVDTDVGPVHQIVRDGSDLVLVSDSVDDPRWPAWSKGIAEFGLRSVLAVGLQTNGSTFGVLQFSDRRPFAFEPDDAEIAHLLARHAAVAVASAQQEASLWQMADARKQVGQAQGILMERFDIDAQGAFALLRRYSQDYNIKLRDAARLLTQTRYLPSKP